MKKLTALAAIICMLVSSVPGHAAEQKESFYTIIEGLDNNTYYTVTAETESSGIDSDAIFFAGTQSAVLPAGDATVYVRGVKPVNGRIIAGYTSDPDYEVTVTNIRAEQGEEYTFLMGGDITQANYIASLGGKYYDFSGEENDPITILSEGGVKLARIRLSNTTGKGTGDGDYYLPEGFQDLDDCLDLCRRAKENGMAIEFTFNLSDYWSNAERQIVPSDWSTQIKEELGYDITDTDFLKSMTAEQKAEITARLTEIEYDYVKDVMEQLKAQGTTPEYVSIGNEVNGGLLFPFGASFDMQLSARNLNAVWGDDRSEDDILMPAETEALAGFMNAGYDAVKAVSPDTQVIIHLAEGAKLSSYTWALEIYNSAGTKYDILGASYYPAWSNNTVEGCVEFCNAVYEQYKKPIMIMETGFNWNETMKNGFPGQLIDIEAYRDKYPPTPEGQKAFLADLINGLKSVTDGACIGAIYWDPIMIHVEDPENPDESLSGWAVRESDDGTEPDIVENTTFFDFDGKPLPIFDVTRACPEAPCPAVIAEYDDDGVLTGTVTAAAATDTEILYTLDAHRKLFIMKQ